MDFVDSTILRLATEPSRSAAFDGETLAQLLSASHDLAGTGVVAPFAMIFDEVCIAYDDEPRVEVAGSWMTMGHAERTELALQAPGIGATPPRADLLIAGAITATAQGASAKIVEAEVTWLELAGIDGEITPLPSDPVVLEQLRRERLLARIRARLDQPAVFDDAALGRWLDRLGASSVTELLTRPAVAAGATLKVQFGDTLDQAARVRRFPFAAALLIRNAPIQLAALLDETRRLRPHLHRLGFATRDGDARARRAPLVAWVLPLALFDDEGWPGANPNSSMAEKRAQRRQALGAWLARERIGLIVPPT